MFRSKDGGANWEKVLFLSDSVGAVDLAMNPANPRILYAGMWRAERKPWTLIDASEDGGLYKTTDGGDNWEKLEGGLPKGLTGRIGVTVSPANPDRVWAIVNAHDPDGGVYRSDDAGKSWSRVNGERKLQQRHWYYSHIVADPADENTVYAMNTDLYRSIDAGKSWQSIRVPHGDVHDLWINPENADFMVVGNDGGAQVSLNAGASWSTLLNQPTAELYRVITDDRFPYRIYAAQQDNSTISLPSRSSGGLTPYEEWYDVGGCESGHIAVDPKDPDVYLRRVLQRDHQPGQPENGRVPERDAGAGPGGRGGSQGAGRPIPVELPHRLQPPRPQYPVRHIPARAEEHGPGDELGGHQPGPHHRRLHQTGVARRAPPARPHLRGGVHHHLRLRGVAPHAWRALGRNRRRAGFTCPGTGEGTGRR